jgi:hypothetical protein
VTASIKYNPDGAGKYTAGTLQANQAAFDGGSAGKICTYDLDITKSTYVINSNGIGFEVLAWTAPQDQAAPCPPTFSMQTAIAVRAQSNENGFTIRSDEATFNLLDQGVIGTGFCVK